MDPLFGISPLAAWYMGLKAEAVPGTPPATPPATPPTPAATPPTPSEGTVPQSEVDRIVQERLAREKAKYADYDELKEKAAKLDEAEAANQTELQKAQAAVAKEKEDREAAERKVQEQQAESRALLRRSQVETAAIKAGAVDPADVHALLSARDFKIKKDDKELAVTIGDDGQVTGVEEVVKAFLEEKPNLVGNTPPPPGDGGPRTPIPPKDRQAQIKEAEEKGDYATAMALKNQQLAEVRERQQAGGQ